MSGGLRTTLPALRPVVTHALQTRDPHTISTALQTVITSQRRAIHVDWATLDMLMDALVDALPEKRT